LNKVIYIFILLSCLSCAQKETELSWTRNFQRIGTQSSVRAADLNNDGVKDIVIGAGKAELDSTPLGILALDGLTGESLWEKSTTAQIVGSATFTDITDDGIADVFIGGRDRILKAINGSTGDIIWQYNASKTENEVLRHAVFNFYNSTLIDDVNDNGYPELLTINGGNWEAKPGETIERYPAVLMLIDAKDGRVIAADTMPDGKESYMSPIAYQQSGSEATNIIIGTGGETIGGSIYLTSLDDLLNNKLDKALQVITEKDHGYIAPPIVADLNDDGVLDITIASHSATITAIDGENRAQLWQHSLDGYECSSSFAVGQFTSDEIPDIVTVVSKGVWPDYSDGLLVVINGATGEVEYQESLGCFSLTTPVVYDLNDDGLDEVIMSINKYDCDIEFINDIKGTDDIANIMIALDLKSGTVQEIDKSPRFRNIYGSPWIGDLDDDGYLDIVYGQNYDSRDLFKVGGMRIKRISSSIKMSDENVAWGEYMGKSGKGIYEKS